MALAWAVPLQAAKSVHQSLSADADADIEIECISGALRIEGWERNDVEVSGTLGDDAELELGRSGREISIEVDVPGRRRSGQIELDADLDIRVPSGARIEVETLSATVIVRGVTGAMEIDTMSGDVTVQTAPGGLEIETVSGRIDVTGAGGPIEASSVSGAVHLRGMARELRVESVSGDVEVETADLERAEFELVSGSLHVASGLAPGARLDIEGYSGNVTLSLPTDVSASFRVETFSGNIDNALGVEGQRTGDRGPGKRLELITGAGDARVHVETFSGNVELERRP
jgi:DUF4097 and DUF4098 domain-containing protein YvlB